MLKPFTERLDPSVGDTVIANRKSFATFKTKIISAIDELQTIIFKAPYTTSQHNRSATGRRRIKKKRGKKTRNNRN